MFALPFLPVNVSVSNGIVRVANINSRLLEQDIYNEFRAIRISKHIFMNKGWYSLEFYEFFALEFYHILEVIKNNDNLSVSVGKVKQLQKEIVEKTWLKRIFETHPSIMDFKKLNMFRFTPLPKQREFMDTFNDTLPKYGIRGMLLAGVPGSGKTFTSLATMECLDVDLIVVFCPLNAVWKVWSDSLNGEGCLYRQNKNPWIAATKQPYDKQRYLIIHYESIKNTDELKPHLDGKKIGLIVDESHNLNEMTSDRTQQYVDFCKNNDVRYVIPASGTPFKALSRESVPFFKIIDPLFTDEVCEIFTKIYSNAAGILTRRLNMVSFKIPDSALNLEQPLNEDVFVAFAGSEKFTLQAIEERMKDYAKTRGEELESLRPQNTRRFWQLVDQVKALHKKDPKMLARFESYATNIAIIIQASKNKTLIKVIEQMRECSAFDKEVIRPALSGVERKEFDEVKTITKYPELKVRGECLGRVLGGARIEAYMELATHFKYKDIVTSTDKKTLIYTTYADVVKRVHEALKKEGFNPEYICAEKTKDLARIVDLFKKDPTINPLVATYAALSTAVPLTEADTMVIINTPYRQYIMTQTIARIRRIGATSRARIFYAIIDTGDKPNISTRGVDILNWSKESVLRIFDIEESVFNADGVEYGTEKIVFASEMSTDLLSNW